ncbi:MAG: hypothetical protein PHX34_02960 [Candidatus Shapirobacteria bacterium]|nr:hypothetical protein [Candidatus Shapirobacteria bacterium]
MANRETFRKNGNGDRKTKKKPIVVKQPKVCCMTLQQKLDEIASGKSNRVEEILNKIENKDLRQITEHNFIRYLPIFITCFNQRYKMTNNCWEPFKKKMCEVIPNVNSQVLSLKRVQDILRQFYSDPDIQLIVESSYQKNQLS